MKKINIVKENTEYNRIISEVKPYKFKDYILYLYKNEDIKNYQFGFSVGKKIGKAVVRNKIKRQLKNILDKNLYKNGFKCIIIVRKSILTKSFEEMKNNLNEALDKINIKKEIKNEKIK